MFVAQNLKNYAKTQALILKLLF